jgi:hypothetical protein
MCIKKNVRGVEYKERTSNFGIIYEIMLSKSVIAGGP